MEEGNPFFNGGTAVHHEHASVLYFYPLLLSQRYHINEMRIKKSLNQYTTAKTVKFFLYFFTDGVKQKEREREITEIFSPFCLTVEEIMSARLKMCGASTFEQPSKVDCDPRDKRQGPRIFLTLHLYYTAR